MKTLTIQDVLDAMEKNGLPMHQGDYFDINGEGKVVAACIWGQAARNLNVEASELQGAVSEISGATTGEIVRMNDYGNPNAESALFVPTPYKAVVEFAKKVLSPFAQKEITIDEYAEVEE